MTRYGVTKTIKAPLDRVFRTVSDIGNFSKAVPDIVNVEFLSETRSGIGAGFARPGTNRTGQES